VANFHLEEIRRLLDPRRRSASSPFSWQLAAKRTTSADLNRS